ncbi:MAG: hypothetical protein HYR49_07440 [Gammaproteobacteria bacterium]|nr:hypothetical protein [Gammaproteobacteria bacterium]
MTMNLAPIILLPALAAAGAPAREVSLLDFWRDKCAQGDTEACARIRSAQPGVDRIARLDAYAEQFAAGADRAGWQDGRRPRLDRSYIPALTLYFQGEQAVDAPLTALDEQALGMCARHYHHYWVDRKLWWPTDENRQPDWRAIYYFIVDHYLGVCLPRRF